MDGQTDRQTHDDSIFCASIASRGKNQPELTDLSRYVEVSMICVRDLT